MLLHDSDSVIITTITRGKTGNIKYGKVGTVVVGGGECDEDKVSRDGNNK